jgi:hypothetical protein
MAQTEYAPGPCPPKEAITNHIRALFQEVGPHSLTMKILRLRLSSIYKIDFKDHTQQLSEWVQEVIAEPSTTALLNESAKEKDKKIGGTRKSKSTTKKERAEKPGKKEKEEKKSKKKHRAEGEPKKATTSYFFFTNEKRPSVTEEIKSANGGKADIGAIGKRIGELWSALSDAEKAPYEAQAVKDKERYKTEFDAWTAGGGKKESSGGKKGKKAKKEKDANKPKRATTAYFAFMNEVAPALREKSKEGNNGKVSIADVGKQVGALWNALDAAGKAKYEKIANDDKLRYDRECREKGYAVKDRAPGVDAAAAKAKADSDDDSSSSSSSSSSSDSDDE